MNPLLMPTVAVQGIWVRSMFKLAEPPEGSTSGTAGDASGRPVHVVVVGDSTAAGSGVDTQEDGFAGCLARSLAARTDRLVAWQAVGEFGATARRIRYKLLPRLNQDLDVAVLLAGGNDVLARRTPEQWEGDLSAIVEDLGGRAEQVVVVGIPPFQLFPSLPVTLRRYLGERAGALNEVSRKVCAEQPRASWVTLPGTPPADFFARDNFHPSASGYRLWAGFVADRLKV